MLVFENNIDTDSSFNTMFHADGGKVFIQAYAAGGIVANTPMLVQFMGSGYAATLISACTAEMGYCGYPKDGKALASGCVGWVQVRGKIEEVQGFVATAFTGSVGHSVFMGATATAGGLGATSSANVGNGAIGQIGVLLEAASGSLTTTVYLTGIYSAVLDLAP
jgi:hypothetical protein